MLLIKFTEPIWMKPNGTMDSGPIGKYIQRAMAFLLELNGELSVWNCCTIVWIEQQWNHACARPYHPYQISMFSLSELTRIQSLAALDGYLRGHLYGAPWSCISNRTEARFTCIETGGGFRIVC